jgi:hypothetical protein
MNHMKQASVIEVLRVVVAEGDGKETIYRNVTYYFSTEGDLLAVNDPCPDGKTPEPLI